MVTVEWDDACTRLQAQPGERLLDVADERPQFGTLFACRSGHCGTCRVRVLEGHAALTAAAADELETLEQLAAQPDERLACQLTLAMEAQERRVRLATVVILPLDAAPPSQAPGT